MSAKITVQLQEGEYVYDETANDFVWRGTPVGDPIVCTDGTVTLPATPALLPHLGVCITVSGDHTAPPNVVLKVVAQ